MELRSPALDSVLDTFVSTAHRITYCHLVTVDRYNRPRSRLIHPMWAAADGSIVGWLGTRPTPLKVAHLDHSPYVSCAYNSAEHDFAVAECAAEWVTDVRERRLVWERFKAVPAPVGYDPATIWSSTDADDYAVLRFTPWRITVGLGAELATGARPHVWCAPPRRQRP
jgi:hypothetical protein